LNFMGVILVAGTLAMRMPSTDLYARVPVSDAHTGNR
jgi:hypothetical protein